MSDPARSTPRFARRLRYFVPALLTVAVALVLFGGYVLLAMAIHQTSPVQIALVARENELASRMAGLSAAVDAPDPDERLARVHEIQATAEEWRRLHDGLVASSRSALGSALAGEQEIERHMDTFDYLLGQIDAGAEELSDLAASGALTSARAAEIGNEISDDSRFYTYTLDHLDLLRARAMQGTLDTVRLLGGVAIVASGLLLTGLVFGLLIPAQRTISRQFDELDRASEELRQNKRMLAQFYIEASRGSSERQQVLTEVSHDLRSPLTTIALAAALARRGLERGHGVTHHLDLIRDNCQRATILLRETLEDSRHEQHDEDPSSQAVPLRSIIDKVIARSRPEARRKGIGLVARVDSDAPAEIETNPDKLERMLENLVGNAVKFTAEGGVEVIASAAPNGDGGVALEIRDTGIGIREEDLARVFARYQRVGEDGDGFGLGLPIARRLATQMGGTLTATSQVGRGSSFVVRLPVGPRVRAERPPLATSHTGVVEAIRQTRALEGVSVLIADHDADARRVLGDFLRDSGADVATAATGDEAIALARDRNNAGSPFDCVFVDLELPDRDGYVVCELLRERDSDTSIIAVSAAPIGAEERVRRAGFDGWVERPLSERAIAENLVLFRAFAKPEPRSASPDESHAS